MTKQHPFARFALRVLLGLAGSLYLVQAYCAQLPGPLVDPAWLAQHQDQVVILDVRKPNRGQRIITANISNNCSLTPVFCHIPGAVLIDYKKVRSTRQINGKTVQKMLPEKQAFEALLQEAGVNRDSTVVIVTNGKTSKDIAMGTRLYWQLKYYGHDDVAILNGGTARWTKEHRPVTSGFAKVARGNWVAKTERRELLATTGDITEAVADPAAQLIDTRPVSQYLGLARPGYVYASGHLAGARNYPSELLAGQGAGAGFLGADQYRRLMNTLSIDPKGRIITYCNSGHDASATWFVLHELLGNKNVALYDGSMHQWTLEQRQSAF